MPVRLQDRRRVALVAGTFVLVIGAVYYAFMAAWLDVFLVVGLSNTLRIGLALTIGAINVKDFVAPPEASRWPSRRVRGLRWWYACTGFDKPARCRLCWRRWQPWPWR